MRESNREMTGASSRAVRHDMHYEAVQSKGRGKKERSELLGRRSRDHDISGIEISRLLLRHM